jgi:hypothetical protein
MKNLSKWMTAVGCGVMLSQTLAWADDSNTNPTTGIDVVRGAVQQLEDELAKRGSQTQLTSDEYQVWNKQFRAQLNDALNEYEEQLEVQIIPKLQPLTDQYNTILSQTALRPDQVGALSSLTLTQLQKVADSLVGAKEALYQQAFEKIFPFFPAAKLTYIKGKQYGDITYHYDISTPGTSSVQAMSGDCKLNEPSGDAPANEADTKGLSVTTTWFYASACRSFTGKTVRMDHSSSVDYRPFFDHFIVPVMKDGCSTQLCETLKQEDLVMTMLSLAKNVDQPFVVSFSDGESAKIAYSTDQSVSNNAYDAMMTTTIRQTIISYQYIDSSLPFSDSGK